LVDLFLTLAYLTSSVGRLLRLPSTETGKVWLISHLWK